MDLSAADLTRTNLVGARLIGARLIGARLIGANLPGADLTRTNLTEANLAGANLTEANLTAADLSGANLTDANLERVMLNITTLTHTQFSRARFYRTTIADCDLSVALGLDSARFFGASSIRLDTIVKSGSNIPEEFLRGCGVPDAIITYMRSLVLEPIEFYTCFISYAHQDQAFASRLYADLQDRGVRCWYYPESATVGRRVWEDVERSIKVYDKLVVIFSQASLSSPAVVREIEVALNKEYSIAQNNAQRNRETTSEKPTRLTDPDVLFPIRIDDYVFSGWEHHRKHNVISRNVGDFVGWETDVRKYQDSLNRLLHALDPKSWPAVG